jgi:hypothetical protein
LAAQRQLDGIVEIEVRQAADRRRRPDGQFDGSHGAATRDSLAMDTLRPHVSEPTV